MTESAEGLECPGCGSSLEPQSYGRLEIDRCPECGDLWFDPRELADYLAHRGAASTGVDWAGRCRDATAAAVQADCPRCKAARLHPCKWGTLRFNRCEGCFGAHVTRAQLEGYLAEVGESEGIGGGEAVTSAVGSIAGIVASFFVHGKSSS